MDILKKAIGAFGDVINKARLFDEDIKTEGEVLVAKIIKVLVTFTRKVETALVDIRRLIFGSSAGESNRPPMPPSTDLPKKEKPLSEVKTPQPQQHGKEVIVETSEEVPPVMFMTKTPAGALAVTPILKRRRSESTDPSLWKGKEKEPSPKLEELEESSAETGSSKEEARYDQVTPPQGQKKGVNTRSSDKKRPPSELKTPLAD